MAHGSKAAFRERAFLGLSLVLGVTWCTLGLGLVFAFFNYQAPGRTGLYGMGPSGHYFAAYTGCALVAWGGALVGALRGGAAARTVGTATALALVLLAACRMVAWIFGDYSSLGNILRVEAAIFLALALAFVWCAHQRQVMLRWLATLGILALFFLNVVLPWTPIGRRGHSAEVRADAQQAVARVGEAFPDFELPAIDGDAVRLSSLHGQRVLLMFERSLDWCPFTKTRLMELRDALEGMDDLVVLYVLAGNQVNVKTRRFIEEKSLRPRVRFLVDGHSGLIDQLRLRKPNPERIEAGVPHPSTYVIDRAGMVRFADVRADFHVWIDPELVMRAARDAS